MKRTRTRTLALLLPLIVTVLAQAQTMTAIHDFTGADDGDAPFAPLTWDSHGNLYGTTTGGYGLLGGSTGGQGTVFELSPDGFGGWTETTLYNFCQQTDCVDGAYPWRSPVIFDGQGNLYGTTNSGGAYGYGTVFELSQVGGVWTETVIYSFTNKGDGCFPETGVVMDKAGNLYGTTQSVPVTFELSPLGDGLWAEQTIWNTAIGKWIAIDSSGNLFGANASSIYELSNTTGVWKLSTIDTLNVNSGSPLTFDNQGRLYGTTKQGGTKGYGTVYRLTKSKTGKWTGKNIYVFKGGKLDGAYPMAGVSVDGQGNVYGTTFIGPITVGSSGYGTVFDLVYPLPGSTVYKEKVLWKFSNASGSGEYPQASAVVDGSGNVYGTTSCGGQYGSGIVFEVKP